MFHNVSVLRNRVITASAPGVAGNDAFDRQPAAFDGAVFLQRLDAVVGASRGIAAGTAEPGRQGDLVKSDQPDEQLSEWPEFSFHIC